MKELQQEETIQRKEVTDECMDSIAVGSRPFVEKMKHFWAIGLKGKM